MPPVYGAIGWEGIWRASHWLELRHIARLLALFPRLMADVDSNDAEG